jgi:hypothetical protein
MSLSPFLRYYVAAFFALLIGGTASNPGAAYRGVCEAVKPELPPTINA